MSLHDPLEATRILPALRLLSARFSRHSLMTSIESHQVEVCAALPWRARPDLGFLALGPKCNSPQRMKGRIVLQTP